MNTTVEELGHVENTLSLIKKEKKRLSENRMSHNRTAPLKIVHYSDTPLMCDLSRMEAYDTLWVMLNDLLDDREMFFLAKKKSLAKQLVEELSS